MYASSSIVAVLVIAYTSKVPKIGSLTAGVAETLAVRDEGARLPSPVGPS